MDNFTLLETFTITPSESKKYIHLDNYECTEFLIYGEIPKTENTTTFNIGVEECAVGAAAGSNIHATEMYAHIYKIDNKLIGFVGFESGWSNGNKASALLKSPRVTAETAKLKVQFYPFVSGDEQAVLKIYGR